ncbi:hypothetical protein [Microbacterium sp. NPDC056052]|uniref:hypothetical protein n=1 Tax=Microbacterium sp. NPDC056052 TaxID=3345695 RepID=UPI0035E116A9
MSDIHARNHRILGILSVTAAVLSLLCVITAAIIFGDFANSGLSGPGGTALGLYYFPAPVLGFAAAILGVISVSSRPRLLGILGLALVLVGLVIWILTAFRVWY